MVLGYTRYLPLEVNKTLTTRVAVYLDLGYIFVSAIKHKQNSNIMQATTLNTKTGDKLFNRAFKMTVKVISIEENTFTAEVIEGRTATLRVGSVFGDFDLRFFDTIEETKMSITKKLTVALVLFTELNRCFTTNEHNEFVRLRDELFAEGVDEKEFDALMNTIFKN